MTVKNSMVYSLVAYRDDYEHGRPQLLHLVRKRFPRVTRAACGKAGHVQYEYPYSSWIVRNAPIMCNVCYGYAADIEVKTADAMGLSDVT